MIPKVVQFLKDNNLTLNQISRASDISPSTLSNTFKRPVNSWKVSIFLNLAKVSHAPLNNIIQYFCNYHWTLDINNQKQIIQGAHISDKKAFSIIKMVVSTECNEGWHPSYIDIKNLVRNYYHPQSRITRELQRAKKQNGF